MKKLALSFAVVAAMSSAALAQGRDPYWVCRDAMPRDGMTDAINMIPMTEGNLDFVQFTFESAKDVKAWFDKAKPICESTCKGIETPSANRGRDGGNIEALCKLAADPMPYLKYSAVMFYKKWRRDTKPVDAAAVKEKLVAKDGYLFELRTEAENLDTVMAKTREQLNKSKMEEYFKWVGATEKDVAEVLDWVNQEDVVRWKVLDELAPTFTFSKKGNKDAKIEALAKKQVLKDVKGAKVLATVMQEKDYKVNKNALGIPTDRWKDGSVLYQVKGEKWCRQEGFTYNETYNGKKFVPSQGLRLNLYRYIDCKNIK